MRFKAKRTFLDDSTARLYADTAAGPNPMQRDVRHQWDINIDSLEALMAFVREHGELVIGTDGEGHSIELYDAYRESDPEGTEHRERL